MAGPIRRLGRAPSGSAADTLPALLDAAGVERATLLGHSDGGSIALLAAAAFPARVEAPVLEAPHVFVEDISVASIAQMQVRHETTNLRERLARHHRADVLAASRSTGCRAGRDWPVRGGNCRRRHGLPRLKPRPSGSMQVASVTAGLKLPPLRFCHGGTEAPASTVLSRRD